MNYDRIRKDFQNMTADTQKLIDKYNQACDQIKNQEIAISRVKDQLDKLQAYKAQGLLKEGEDVKIDNLKKKLEIFNNKLEDSKEKASDLKNEIDDSMNEKSVANFGGKIDEVGNKIDKFRKRISSLLIGTFVFNVLRSGLTSLRNTFFSLLKTNDQFASSLNQIKANLMTAFTPIYNVCLPAINSLMNMISKLTGTIAIFVSSLFGKSIKDTTKDAKKLTGALNKTTTSAKKASGALGSFDNLEVLPDTSSAGGSVGGGTDSSGIDYNGEITYSQKLLDILYDVWDALEPIRNFIKNFQKEHGTLATAILVVGGALAGLFIIKKIIGLFKNLGKTVVTTGTNFTGFMNGLGEFLSGIGKAVTAIAILGGLALVIGSITDLIKEFNESGLTLGKVAGLLGIVLGEIAAAFVILAAATNLMNWTGIAAAVVILGGMVLVLESISNLISTLSESSYTLSETCMALGIILAEIVVVMTAIAVIAKTLTSNPLTLVGLLALTASISAILIVLSKTLPIILKSCGDFIVNIAPFVIELIEKIFKGIEDIIYSLGTTLPPIINSIGSLFNSIFSGIDKIINSVGKNICNILNTAKKLVTDVLSSIVKFINDLGPAIDKFVTRVINSVTKLINFIISGMEYLVNTLIVKGVNKIIKSINSISEYVGITIPTVSPMQIPRFVPRLATGAVIPPRQEFMAILGDQKHGTNIEAPLDTIKQANREVLEEIFGRNGIDGQSKEIILRNWQFILQFGGTEFGKLIIDEIKKYQDETGTQFLLA